MKLMKKTYGVYDMVEWRAELKGRGGARVRIEFTGGSTTTQGVIPATYTTENPLVQLVIESSQPWNDGKIKLVRQTPVKNAVAAAVPAEPQIAPVPEMPQADKDAEAVAEEAAVTVVTVGCFEDAVEYARAEWGVASSKVRSRAAVQAEAALHGVRFEYKS